MSCSCDPTRGREGELGAGQPGEGAVRLVWPAGESFTGQYSGGVRTGWGVVTAPAAGLQALTGVWAGGGLQGRGRLVTHLNTTTICNTVF